MEPTLDQLRQAFHAHGVEAPPEYVWLVQHRTLGFDAFAQFEPWHFCGVEEILPLSKRWPKAGIQRQLIPFARMQGSDDLVCFEFVDGRVVQICHIHYDLGPPVYVEFYQDYPTIWDWLSAALNDVKLWFELAQKREKKTWPDRALEPTAMGAFGSVNATCVFFPPRLSFSSLGSTTRHA